MGRQTKLTSQKQEEIIKLIKMGAYHNVACECSDIDYSTFRRWIQKGEVEKTGKYREFRDALQQAEAHAEIRMITIWQGQVKDDWKAAQAFLERRFPDRWGRKERHEITGANGGPIEIEEVREKLLRKFNDLNLDSQKEEQGGKE